MNIRNWCAVVGINKLIYEAFISEINQKNLQRQPQIKLGPISADVRSIPPKVYSTKAASITNEQNSKEKQFTEKITFEVKRNLCNIVQQLKHLTPVRIRRCRTSTVVAC
jgi:hypothetical protein